ncbi:hypothetical protein [Streptomyces lavendulocolor]|uniref:hypothetical protein n=1 Tax=Streptomyces lavendulocolor TaxID=67316 RepID=UPI003C2F6563
MSSATERTGGSPRESNCALVLGALSVASWFCCPFWILVSALTLPLGLAGLVRGCWELRTASTPHTGRARPLTALALSTAGTLASVAYLTYVLTHPELPIQD